MKGVWCFLILLAGAAACTGNSGTISVNTDSVNRELDTLGSQVKEKTERVGDSVKAEFNDIKESVKAGLDSIKSNRGHTAQ